MADPLVAPPAPPPDPTVGSPWTGDSRERSRAPRRAADTLTLLLLVATAGAVLSSAVPLAVRALMPSQPPPAQRGIARTLRSRGLAVGPPRAGARAPAMDLFGPSAHLPLPSLGSHEGDSEPGHTQLVVAKQDVVLRLRADAAGPKVGVVPAGAVMIIARQAGPWALVVSGEEGNVVMGWALKDALALP